MKSYKFLVPLLLVVVFAASLYMLIDTKATIQKQYDGFLAEARNYREQGVDVDAEKNYMSALNVKKSLSLSIEIGEFYRDSGQVKKSISWGETIITDYPKAPEAYEFLMDIYRNRQDYVACFELSEKFEKRKLSSAKVSEIISDIEYTFFFNGEYADVGIFSGGLCPVLIEDKWGYVNQQGDKVIANKYTKVGPFSGDLSPVVDKDKSAYFIDPQGNKKHVVQGVDKITELGLIENGIFSLYNGSKWAFYDYDNNYLFGDYDDVSSIGNGVAAVSQNDKWSLIGRDGNKKIDDSFYGVAMDEKSVVYRNDRVFVLKETTYSMIDLNGKEYGDGYEDVHIFNDNTYAAVRIKGKWGFVNANGDVVIEAQYDDARSFSNGLAAVKKDGKWGFIDKENKLVIQPQFDDSKDFSSSGSVFVLRNGDWELLRLFKYNH